MEQNYPIITKTYELLKNSLQIVKQFPRDQKFFLGDRIQSLIADVLEIYIEAIYTSKKLKKPLLQKANIQLEKLRHYIRLAYELGLISSGKYKETSEQIQEIGKMTGGWLKKL